MGLVGGLVLVFYEMGLGATITHQSYGRLAGSQHAGSDGRIMLESLLVGTRFNSLSFRYVLWNIKKNTLTSSTGG